MIDHRERGNLPHSTEKIKDQRSTSSKTHSEDVHRHRVRSTAAMAAVGDITVRATSLSSHFTHNRDENRVAGAHKTTGALIGVLSVRSHNSYCKSNSKEDAVEHPGKTRRKSDGI